MTTDTPEALVEAAARSLRAYLASDRQRTDYVKEVAEQVYRLRALHHLADGRPDWSGRSAAYRADVHRIYSEARVPAEVLDTVQAAIRYHLGNLLRARVSVEDLRASGLSATSPRQRLDRDREIAAAVAASTGRTVADPLRLLAHTIALLEVVDDEALASLAGRQRGAGRAAAARIASHAERIGAALAPRQAANGSR